MYYHKYGSRGSLLAFVKPNRWFCFEFHFFVIQKEYVFANFRPTVKTKRDKYRREGPWKVVSSLCYPKRAYSMAFPCWGAFDKPTAPELSRPLIQFRTCFSKLNCRIVRYNKKKMTFVVLHLAMLISSQRAFFGLPGLSTPTRIPFVRITVVDNVRP